MKRSLTTVAAGLLAIIACVAAEKLRQTITAPVTLAQPISIRIDSCAIKADIDICFNMSRDNSNSRFCVTLSDDNGGEQKLCLVQNVSDNGSIYELREFVVNDTLGTLKRFTEKLNPEIDLHGGDNYLVLAYKPGRGDVYIGKEQLKYVVTVPIEKLRLVKLEGLEGAVLQSVDIQQYIPKPTLRKQSVSAIEALAAFPSANVPTGSWSYLDRDNEPDYARPGGKYKLAVIPAQEEGAFEIYYIGGAEVGAQMWEPGMLKGILTQLPFDGRYKLEWWDSEMNRVDGECNAELEDGILSLKFPLLHSTLRFVRL